METAKWLKTGKNLVSEIVLITFAATLVIFVLRAIDNFRVPRVPSNPNRPLLTVGAQLKIASTDLTHSPVSIILMSSPTCPYCLISKPFHNKLIAETNRNHVPFYVAVPSRKEAAQYLQDVGFAESSVKEWRDLNLRADATPTIVAVDNTAAVRSVWVGVLPPFDEVELLKAVQSHSSPSSSSNSSRLKEVPNYSSQDMDGLKAKQNISLVDMHERGYSGVRSGAITIPLLEVPYRAPYELNEKTLQIVDCSNINISQCKTSVDQLIKAGFRVATLNAGLYRQTCKATLTDKD